MRKHLIGMLVKAALLHSLFAERLDAASDVMFVGCLEGDYLLS
jgi:hypothetical protein